MSHPESPATIVVFPGQGSQRSGMGRDFHHYSEAARRVYDEASDALALDVAALCFEDDPRLGLTEFAQPAILTTAIAMLRALQAETDLAVAAWGGHSLGEYSALVAAGALPLAAAVRIVPARGRLMQEAVPVGRGGMVAVIGAALDVGAIARAIADLAVDVANDNSREQVVLSGLAGDVRTAMERLAPMASRLVPLEVSAPFHSRLMAAIEPEFGAVLRDMAASVIDAGQAAAVTANVTGGFHATEPESVLGGLIRQVSSTVRWRDNMEALLAAGARSDRGQSRDAGRASRAGDTTAVRVLEIGPTAPLRGFFRTLGVAVEPVTSVRTLARVAGRPAAVTALAEATA